jgi:hypothetical protein
MQENFESAVRKVDDYYVSFLHVELLQLLLY